MTRAVLPLVLIGGCSLQAADLVVLDGDPAKDITALSKVRLVIRAGSILYKP
jgi:hypothetical protein